MAYLESVIMSKAPIGMTQKGEFVYAEDIAELRKRVEVLEAAVEALRINSSRLQGQTHIHGDDGIPKMGLPPLVN